MNGGFVYNNLYISQHPDTPKVFKTFLNTVRPNRILEIGTFHGGLTILLRDILDELGLQDNTIRTYDINEQIFLKPLIQDRNIDIFTKNLFTVNYADWYNESSKQEIYDYLIQDGVSLILCDGGCKRCEFNLISPLLKSGDIIMAHDYAPNSEYLEKYIKDKIWNWHEIQDKDIIEVSEQYGLEPFCQELMQNIAWCSRRRENG